MIAIPPLKRFKKGDRLYVQAQQIWLILVAFVMHSKRNPEKPAKTTYGELAKKMGYSDRRAGHMLNRQLWIVGKLCEVNNLPPLNTIVVNKDTGAPGQEVFLRKGRTLDQEQADVMREDWFKIRVPTTGTFRKIWEQG
jgi:hypothetical protein